MEPLLPNQEPNQEYENEMERKMRSMEGLPPEENGLSKKRKIQIVIVAIVLMLIMAIVLFLMGSKNSQKPDEKVSAANRGLMQAESIRRQKELFDEKSNRKNMGEEGFTHKLPMNNENLNPMDSSGVVLDAIEPVLENNKFSENLETIKPSPTHSNGLISKLNHVKSNKKSSSLISSNADPSFENNNELLPIEKPKEYKNKPELASRLSEEYQKAVAYNASEQLVFTKDRGSDGQKDKVTMVNATAKMGSSNKVIVSAGQEMTAVLNESLDSDYPSVAKATLTSPSELVGTTVLLSYSLGNERVTAQIMKMVLPPKDGEKAKEITLSAVVKSGLPGLSGDVSHHWTSQIAAGVASAGLTAGALAYAAQNGSKDLGTAVLVAPMVEQSVQGVLKPINYLGRDRPVTVTVPAGTEFTILVTEGFEVNL